MAKLVRTFGECEENHPEVWRLGTDLADVVFSSRSDYLREQTRTREGADRYIRTAGEHLLTSLGNGTLAEEMGVEFPEPVTESSGTCFGIAFSKRLHDLFDDQK